MSIINKDYKTYLYSRLIMAGFHPDTAKILIAQAAFETGNFASRIFKENNNLFGMKLPRVRQTTATGEKYGHAKFSSLEDSIQDMRLYFNSVKIPTVFNSVSSYVKTLVQKKYFEASPEAYENGVEHYYDVYFSDNGK